MSKILLKPKFVEVVLINYNLVNNNYSQASKVLFTFVPDKQFDQLTTIAPHSLTMLKLLIQNLNSLKNGLQVKIIGHLK